MKKIISILIIATVFTACNNSSETKTGAATDSVNTESPLMDAVNTADSANKVIENKDSLSKLVEEVRLPAKN